MKQLKEVDSRYICVYPTEKVLKTRELTFKPFREVRNLRQKPAHSVSSNKYDKTLFKEQDNLINRAYESVRTIRLIFANHPKVRDYKVDDWLFEGKIKTF